MNKLLISLLLVAGCSGAMAQGATFYDAAGRIMGSASCSTQGCTYYDANSRAIGFESRSGVSTNLNPVPSDTPAAPPVFKPDLYTNPDPARDFSAGYRW